MDGREAPLPNVAALSKAKHTTRCAGRDLLLDAEDDGIHVGDVIQVGENKGFANVETHGDDVFDILPCKFASFLNGDVFPQELLISCHLNNKRYIECILEIFRENEWDHVTKVEGIATGTTASVEEEGNAFLVLIQYFPKRSV